MVISSYLPSQWLNIQGCLLVIATIFLGNYMWGLLSLHKFPPGPFPLPIIGNLLSVNLMNPSHSMEKLIDYYGDVIRLDLGTTRYILLAGYKGFKEAFVDQGDIFLERPHYPLKEKLSKGLGLITSSGYMWKQQRRFAVSTLKYFGLGSKTLQNSILEENLYLSEMFEKHQGQPFDPHYTIHNAVANIICALVFGHRFEYDSKPFLEILKSLEAFQLPATLWGQMYNQFPTIMHFLPGAHQSAFSMINKIKMLIREEVEKHKKDRVPSKPRDYIDCYLEEIAKCKDEHAEFTEENLLYCVVDLFAAGTETVSKSLRWAILCMAKYPSIQEKVQAEIDTVIGGSRQPSMEDRLNMPYTNAVLYELQRFGNVLTFMPPRMSQKDTTLSGYEIPKGMMVLPMLRSVLLDKEEYVTPNQFNPQHFLDEDGMFLKRENFIPFSIGKRVCPGKHLARMELFLFFTSLLQRFSFCPPEGQVLSLECIVGVTCGPKPFKICVLHR